MEKEVLYIVLFCFVAVLLAEGYSLVVTQRALAHQRRILIDECSFHHEGMNCNEGVCQCQ